MESLVTTAMFDTVCVYAGSSRGNDPAHARAAADLGRTLARRGIRLVFGGGSIGLMGILADAILEHGGHVTGVIPQALVDRELAHGGLSDLRIVGSMHERKQVMNDLSDAFIALPGGFGTLEELLETLTWGQLGIHSKPAGLLDPTGYFYCLRRFLEQAVAEGFLSPTHVEFLLADSDPDRLLDALVRHKVPPVTRWLDSRET